MLWGVKSFSSFIIGKNPPVVFDENLSISVTAVYIDEAIIVVSANTQRLQCQYFADYFEATYAR